MSAPEPEIERFALDVAGRIRAAVVPLLGTGGARTEVGRAPGGDVTMAIDEVAEQVLRADCVGFGDVAFYSEDQGYVEIGAPRAILVVDPIDGTRPAAAGLESSCVSIAIIPPMLDATLGDVQLGIVQEIKSGSRFVARRGRGVEADVPVARSTNADLGALFWTAGLRGRPALPTTVVLEALIDDCGMRGSFFDLGSATFNMTRIVTGQLDAYVDVGRHMVDVYPRLEAHFRTVGAGAVCSNFPYDVAAAALIVEEAGGVVTRPDGSSIAGHPAVGSGDGYGIAVLASASGELHEQLIDAVSAGMDRLGRWLQ